MGWFDDLVKGIGHTALHVAGAPFELTGAALNAVGAKGAANVVNFGPNLLHQTVDDVVDNQIDNTPFVGTIVR